MFTVVNIDVLILRKDKVNHSHFRSPSLLPILGAISCAFLVGPWTGRDPQQYKIAGVLLAIGLALWVVTLIVNRVAGTRRPEDDYAALPAGGPVN